MSLQRLFALMFLEYLQFGTTAFIGIAPTSIATTNQQHAPPTVTTGLSAGSVSSTTSSFNLFMTASLPTPVSISIGPIQYSWYADNAARRRRYLNKDDFDDGDTIFTYAISFGYEYDGEVKLPPTLLPTSRRPFRFLAETSLYPNRSQTDYFADDTNNKKPKRNGRLRAWIGRRLRGRRRSIS